MIPDPRSCHRASWIGFPAIGPESPRRCAPFGCDVIDVVAGLVPAVKFQSAFYEAYGPDGLAALHATVEHAKQKGLLVIFDGKRNDIGSTAEAYARAYLGKVPVGGAFEPSWHADAMTVNPYLGTDGVLPFVKIAAREQKGVFVLVKTSNASAGEFQDLVADGLPVYRHVAAKLLTWAVGHEGRSGYNLVGAVIGATYPRQIEELSQRCPEFSSSSRAMEPRAAHRGISRQLSTSMDWAP